MAEDYKIQFSKTFDEGSLNVRADSYEEFEKLWGQLSDPENEETLLSHINDFTEQVIIKQLKAQSKATPPSSPPFNGGTKGVPDLPPPDNSTPRCSHGVMKDLAGQTNKAGQPYKNRYYCNAPRGEQSCPAKG